HFSPDTRHPRARREDRLRPGRGRQAPARARRRDALGRHRRRRLPVPSAPPGHRGAPRRFRQRARAPPLRRRGARPGVRRGPVRDDELGADRLRRLDLSPPSPPQLLLRGLVWAFLERRREAPPRPALRPIPRHGRPPRRPRPRRRLPTTPRAALASPPSAPNLSLTR